MRTLTPEETRIIQIAERAFAPLRCEAAFGAYGDRLRLRISTPDGAALLPPVEEPAKNTRNDAELHSFLEYLRQEAEDRWGRELDPWAFPG